MPSDDLFIAGLDFGSGRKPVTLAALDDDLSVLLLDRVAFSDAMTYFEPYERVLVGVSWSLSQKARLAVASDFKEKMTQAGIQPYGQNDHPRQWFSTDAQEAFHAFSGDRLFSRRAVEGRIQRALVLYARGLQFDDPMDIFEEITRYKLIQGILPLENLYAFRELDALLAAYLAWAMVNQPARVSAQGDLILPVAE